MSGNKFLVDTNILIYLIDGNQKVAEFLENKLVVISFVTELELLGINNGDSLLESATKNLLQDCVIVDINAEIKKLVIFFRTQYRLKLPDAIILATAKYLDHRLLTADKDFKKVKEADVYFFEN